MVKASAPGKVILFGEHAVVYGYPAIAVPVSQVRAEAVVEPADEGLVINAPDLDRSVSLGQAAGDDPLATIVRLTLAHLDRPAPAARIGVTSTIPVAGGMGSGAAVSTAIARALALYLEVELQPADVSALVYEVEKLYHGTPSGIDNTVVAYEQPVYFVRDEALETFAPGRPLHLLVADSGIPSYTRKVVADVRAAREREPAHYDVLFDQVGEVVAQARGAMEDGDIYEMGVLMDENHELLVELDVSCPELEELVEAARFAGALGAKLSGAGRGGNVIALVEEMDLAEVKEALLGNGARQVIATDVR